MEFYSCGYCELGDNVDNMKIFGESLKKLPYVPYLYLNLSCNGFGDNPENLKYLGDGLKYISNL